MKGEEGLRLLIVKCLNHLIVLLFLLMITVLLWFQVITAKIEGELKTCVSVRAQPVCSKHCLRGSRKQEQVDFKCVSLAEAKKLHIIPVMEGKLMM